MIEHNELQQLLLNELQELEHLQSKLETSLKSAPPGSLHVLQQQGKSPQYYFYESRKKRTYISQKNKELARRLAQKEYEQKLLFQIEERIHCIRNTEQAYRLPLLTVYEEMAEAKKSLVIPHELPEEDFVNQWYDEHPGCMNTYPISTNYYSNRGIHVRSKSEKILADLFDKLDVPYIYEPCIHLTTGSPVYPDFLLLNCRLRKQYLYEHFGIMSDAQYTDRALEKISLYQQNGYFPGVNFLFSMESQNQPLDTRYIEKMVGVYLK